MLTVSVCMHCHYWTSHRQAKLWSR